MNIHDVEAPYVGSCMPKTGSNALKVWAQVGEKIAPVFDHVIIAFDMVACSDRGMHYASREPERETNQP